MLDKFANWIEKHGGRKLTNKILTVCSIVTPAAIGWMLYDTGRAQGRYETESRFAEAIEHVINTTEPIAEVTTKTE